MKHPTLQVFLTLFITLLTLNGCERELSYSGDGKLVDRGASSTERYVLDLGRLRLSEPSLRTFKISQLPETSFVIGLDVAWGSNDSQAGQTGRPNPTVRVMLETESTALLSRQAKLADWTWSIPANTRNAFVYGRDEFSTYFEADSKKSYKLTVEVVEGDNLSPNSIANLRLKSGGWK